MQQRRDRRFKQWNKTLIKAALGGPNPHDPEAAEGFTSDISLGGARIQSEEPFEEGAILRLQIDLVRSRETVILEGLVKWVKRNESENVFEMGVEFLHCNSQTVLSLMKNLHGG